MTLHLALISRYYVLHISDRLVSLDSGDTHDPLANKNLILQAHNAIVSIGYTGIAYGLSPSNYNMPTDEWLAEKLLGKPLIRNPNGIPVGGMGEHVISRWSNIWQTIELLQRELQISVDRLSQKLRNLPFEVIVAGWQRDRHRVYRPVLFTIEKPWGNGSFTIKPPPRQLLDEKVPGAISANPSGYMTETELRNIFNEANGKSVDESEELLVNGIRSVASRHPQKVGSHCLSTLLLPPNVFVPVRVRFLPSVPHMAVFIGEDKVVKQEFPVAFSPWIIAPHLFHSPSTIVGTWVVHGEGFKITIEAPRPDAGILGSMHSLERPPSP